MWGHQRGRTERSRPAWPRGAGPCLDDPGLPACGNPMDTEAVNEKLPPAGESKEQTVGYDWLWTAGLGKKFCLNENLQICKYPQPGRSRWEKQKVWKERGKQDQWALGHRKIKRLWLNVTCNSHNRINVCAGAGVQLGGPALAWHVPWA